MAVINKIIRLAEFQTLDIIPRKTYSPDTYIQPLLIEGNSILSSVYVKSMDLSATLKVNYYDITTGTNGEERYNLQSHELITNADIDPILGFTSRITVTRIHNKPYCEIIISGGNIEFGIYNTIVSAFASDLDSALQYENEDLNSQLDKGIPIAVLDSDTNKWSFLRSTNGRLQVDVPGVLQTSQQLINKRLYNASFGAVKNNVITHIDYTVPVGKVLYLLSGNGTSDSWCTWRVTIDGANWLTKRNAYDERNISISFDNPLRLVAGQRIIVSVENTSIGNSNSEIETWIFGAEENV